MRSGLKWRRTLEGLTSKEMGWQATGSSPTALDALEKELWNIIQVWLFWDQRALSWDDISWEAGLHVCRNYPSIWSTLPYGRDVLWPSMSTKWLGNYWILHCSWMLHSIGTCSVKFLLKTCICQYAEKCITLLMTLIVILPCTLQLQFLYFVYIWTQESGLILSHLCC